MWPILWVYQNPKSNLFVHQAGELLPCMHIFQYRSANWCGKNWLEWWKTGIPGNAAANELIWLTIERLGPYQKTLLNHTLKILFLIVFLNQRNCSPIQMIICLWCINTFPLHQKHSLQSLACFDSAKDAFLLGLMIKPRRPSGKKELLRNELSGHLQGLSARTKIMLVTSKSYFPAYHITALISNW